MTDAYAEPIKAPLSDDTDLALKAKRLESVILWCTSGSLHHWITSYCFVRPHQLDPVERGKDIVGISCNMYQPRFHIYHPADDNLYGCLEVQARPRNKLFSTRTRLKIVLPFQCAVTMKDILDLITDKGLQYYTFHPDGSGCLNWQLSLLSYFVASGWLQEEDVANARLQVSQYAEKAGDAVPWPPRQGKFYTPPSQ
ncbi:hypothetical protein C8Q73DRAFT_8341 [Cubamyces lactineus]|nr:hypothetical protein C8Q73DRAFT_8341 [Cubamyces lactineus]